MWRRSARGWTVIPGAPASTQIRTASSTLGVVPPRALRSVATLLTLTESLTIPRDVQPDDERLGEMLLHRADNGAGHGIDFALVPSFDHHTQQGFGSRIADHETPAAGEPFLDFVDRAGHRGNGL